MMMFPAERRHAELVYLLSEISEHLRVQNALLIALLGQQDEAAAAEKDEDGEECQGCAECCPHPQDARVDLGAFGDHLHFICRRCGTEIGALPES